MNDWKEVSLKEVCKTQYGYTASATDVDTGVRFVRITDIVPDFINWNTVPFCKISEKEFLKYKLNEGDIVAARTGATVGYARQIRNNSPNAVFASYLVKLIPSDKIDKRFLGIIVESNIYKEFIQMIAGGSAQPNANANDLTEFKIKIPSLPTQKQIASILSAYDDLIEVNNQRIKLLEQTARELYKEWFVRMRFPDYKNTKFKQGIPEGWEVVYFRNFIKLNRGFDLSDEKIIEGEYPVVASTSIKAYHKYYKVEAPCVSTGRSGSLGTVQYINKKSWPLNTSLYVKDFKGNSPRFVYYFLQGLNLENFNAGAGVPSLNQNHLHGLKFQLPPKDLQDKFDNFIVPVFEQIETLQQQNTQLRQIRDRLLPRLISGKLQVKEKQTKKKLVI
jgi:type I restriction enzyme, S subunit